jgi:hypothetical protein
VLFNPLFKVLFIFRSLYLCAIGLWPVFSFRRHLPPILSSIPKLLDSSKELYRGLASNRTGLSPSMASRSRELRRRRAKSILYKLQLGPRPDFKFELLPLHSPLLGQSLLVSFPPLIDMLKFSGYSYLIRGRPCINMGGLTARNPPKRPKREENYCARGHGEPATEIKGLRGAPAEGPNTKQLVLEGRNDARTGMPARMLAGAMCVQRFDDSLNSAIHITYRISLRSSSMPEPRDPLLKVLTHLI